MRTLRTRSRLLRTRPAAELAEVLGGEDVDLLLLEVSAEGDELVALRAVREQNPGLPVIAVGPEEPKDLVALAFACGAKDYFKLPYRAELLAERATFLASGLGPQGHGFRKPGSGTGESP